jgi:hypothetical protein
MIDKEKLVKRIYESLTPQAKQRTSEENVRDVLDALVPAWLELRESI